MRPGAAAAETSSTPARLLGAHAPLLSRRHPALLHDQLPVFITSRNTQNSDSELLNVHAAGVHALTHGSGRETGQSGKGSDGGKRGAEGTQRASHAASQSG